jgi:squalene-associated FAD-dependent desaturase
MAADHGLGTTSRRCVVAGGGLAGISAALALQDAGFSVTLVERRPFLGGRAYSFVDHETGQEVDNGQHVFLACCTAYRGFLDRLGVTEQTSLQPRLRAPVVSQGGVRSELSSASWLPAPLHVLPSFLRYKHLSFRERLRTLRVLLGVMRLDREQRRDELERQSFGEWLLKHGEGERAIQRFWNLVVLPTLNDDIGAVSAFMGTMVFQEAFFKGNRGAEIGYAKVGLTELISDAAQRALEEGGGRLVLGQGVTGFCLEGDRVRAVQLSSGERLEGDVFVSAVPWNALPRLLPEPWRRDSFFSATEGLDAAPIVGVHIWYDRQVMEDEFLAFLDSPVQWVFNKTAIMGTGGSGQHVCISLSGAWEYAPMGKEELRALFVGEMAKLFPKAREASVERFIVVKQLAATFRSRPGAEELRPGRRTPIANLFLAGDWTQTGWPSTMESAVRSGELAARAVVETLRRARAVDRPAPSATR